jgi:hypothetical protein
MVFVTVNANECLLTRMQEMSLDYHFTVEQEVGSATHAFFGFNGNSLYTLCFSSTNVSNWSLVMRICGFEPTYLGALSYNL